MSSSDSLKSWGELLCSYRKTYGSQAYSSVTGGSSGGDHQVRQVEDFLPLHLPPAVLQENARKTAHTPQTAAHRCSLCPLIPVLLSPNNRYTRSVPTVCPLAEIKHPLYACGSAGEHGHTISEFMQQSGSHQHLIITRADGRAIGCMQGTHWAACHTTVLVLALRHSSSSNKTL